MTANIPDFRVTLDGVDLTAKVRPRLISLTLTDKRGEEADQLDLTLDDSDGLLAIPPADAELVVQLGWKQGADVTTGLVDKGRFRVDEVEHRGPPDQVTIRARSADFTSDLAQRREKSWRATTIGAILNDIAGRNGLKPRCAPALAGIAVKARSQHRESDLAFLRRLGREHDAVATIKAGALILAPIGAGQTAGGQALATLTLRRRDCESHSYRVEKREAAEGVTAAWHDRKAGKRQEVSVGAAADGGTGKRLARVYPTEAAAKAAATAESTRAARQPVGLDVNLALGRADITPEQTAKVTGFKIDIDGDWLVGEVVHTLGDRGYFTALKLERK